MKNILRNDNIRAFVIAILIVVIICLILSLVISHLPMMGPGLSDNYLMKGYEMGSIDGNPQIQKSRQVYVDGCIISTCYNDRYICAKQVDKVKDSLERVNKENPRYYILDTETESVYGPYSKEEFEEKLEEWNITDLTGWQSRG